MHPLTPGDPWASHFGERYERRIVDHAGHFLPRERPDAFAAAVGDVIARTQ